MGHRHRLAVACLLVAVLRSASTAAPAPPCMGDCNADGRVAISELVLMVNAALAAAPSPCSNGDAAIAVADVVSAVGFALDGCPPAPAGSPTATPVPSDDPAAWGACYGAATCEPCDMSPCRPYLASHAACCAAATVDNTVRSWCPVDRFDEATLRCAGGCAPACAGLWTPTPTTSPNPTPTSCRAVIPVVAPVTPQTDALEQVITLCGIGYASSRVNACGPAGCIEEYTYAGSCPLQCPDSRQACVSGAIPLLPNQPNAIQVCQVPGIGCGPLPDLCAEEDVNGIPLIIEQRVTESTNCQCLLNGGQPDPDDNCPCDVGQCYAACVADLCPGTPQCTLECSFRCSCNSAPVGCPTHEDPGPTPTAVSQ